MQLKVAITNLVMAFVLVFMVLKIVETAREKHLLPNATATEASRPEDYQPVVLSSGLAPMASFDTIVSNNLFSPDRAEYIPEPPPPPPTEVVTEQNVGGKKIHLYGVVIRGGKKYALITNPELGKNVPKYAWVEEGMQVGVMRVSGIEKEHIIIQDNTKKYIILLSENDSAVQEATPAASKKEENVNIVVTGSTQPAAQSTAASGKTKEAGTPAATDANTEAIDTPFGVMHIRKR